MKKFLVVMVVLAFVGLGSIALAADVTVGGSVQVRSRDFNTMTFDKDVNTKNAVDTQERIILNVNAKAGDDVKGKISLWHDFDDWGSNATASGASTPADSNFGNGFGSSATQPGAFAFGFREAWVSFNVPGVPVNLTAGHQLLQLGDGYFFRAMHFGSDAWVLANVTGNNTVALVDVKVGEGSVAVNSDDIDGYVLLDVYKINDNNTVGASFTDVHLQTGNDLYNLELTYGGKIGIVNLKAQADLQSGEIKNPNATMTALGFVPAGSTQPKFKGNEIVVKGNIPVDPVTINFMLGMGSGKKSTDTDNKQMVTFLDVDPHYTFLYEYKLATAGGAVHDGLSNTEVASVGAMWAATKNLNLGLDLYYLLATQKITNGQGDDKNDVGTEIDAKVYWKLYDNLSWNWDLGYFKPGAALKTATGKTDAATGIQGVLALSF